MPGTGPKYLDAQEGFRIGSAKNDEGTPRGRRSKRIKLSHSDEDSSVDFEYSVGWSPNIGGVSSNIDRENPSTDYIAQVVRTNAGVEQRPAQRLGGTGDVSFIRERPGNFLDEDISNSTGLVSTMSTPGEFNYRPGMNHGARSLVNPVPRLSLPLPSEHSPTREFVSTSNIQEARNLNHRSESEAMYGATNERHSHIAVSARPIPIIRKESYRVDESEHMALDNPQQYQIIGDPESLVPKTIMGNTPVSFQANPEHLSPVQQSFPVGDTFHRTQVVLESLSARTDYRIRDSAHNIYSQDDAMTRGVVDARPGLAVPRVEPSFTKVVHPTPINSYAPIENRHNVSNSTIQNQQPHMDYESEGSQEYMGQSAQSDSQSLPDTPKANENLEPISAKQEFSPRARPIYSNRPRFGTTYETRPPSSFLFRGLSSSTEHSRFSSPIPSAESATPGRTPSSAPVTRAVSPSFGLTTTPRPIGRPPPRSNHSGLRHVDTDADPRSKVLMARPRTAIPPHIEPVRYARECTEAASFCRLPPYNLDPTEHRLLRTHINHVQVTTYLNIRNGILRLWMLNPTIAVCREEALGIAKEDRHLEMAAKCHEFLIREGYINFGCIVPAQPLTKSLDMREIPGGRSKRRRKRIVVIGAGAAGLSCARQLENLFIQFSDQFSGDEALPEVIVLEGRDRIGGRIYSYPLSPAGVTESPHSPFRSSSKSSTLSSISTMSSLSTSSFALTSVQRIPDPAVDLGAQIVTGFDNGNPLSPIIKRQLRLRWHYLHDDSQLFDVDGTRIDGIEDGRAERLFNEILERASSLREKTKEPILIEGDKELMDQGKEPHGESGRQIAKVEENEAVLPPMPPSPRTGRNSLPSGISTPSSTPNAPRRRVPGRRALTKMGFQLKENTPERTPDRNTSPPITLGGTMKDILSDIQELVELSPLDLKLLNWHWANLEYGNATNLNNVSLKHWDQDDGNEYVFR
jgi:SWIRM domain/Flavin containing amine oxidoreductase